ncbi:hypothetical protein LG3211_2062 [Lysobacter gummosus]|nr:hypothetical protein LG3211_2062 [Lysobacter gummosus]
MRGRAGRRRAQTAGGGHGWMILRGAIAVGGNGPASVNGSVRFAEAGIANLFTVRLPDFHGRLPGACSNAPDSPSGARP